MNENFNNTNQEFNTQQPTQKELSEMLKDEKVWGKETNIYSSQTKYLSNDSFNYELEQNENDKYNPDCRFNVVKIYVTLDYYG